ncbi:MAG: hypothetical protein HOP12_01420 [Candidatus Eisenbacteria bacterium]|uniref:Lipoprotein n=1 Tax=Eiseniibacteriota bacterium TaxID=2212470 RepID=A0A849SIU8_UNCEI|nr:hypothetical protein [Candidatus Eisenbacteria bacterium]
MKDGSAFFSTSIAVFASIVALLAASCGGGSSPKSTTGAPPSSAEHHASSGGDTATPSAVTARPEGHAAVGEGIEPATTPAAILEQLGQVRKTLASAIEAGRLDEVHQHAFDVRDLVVALHERAQGLDAAAAKRLDTISETVKQLAIQLDVAGDAGDLGRTRTHFAAFEAALDGIGAVQGLASTTLAPARPDARTKPQIVSMTGELIDPQCWFTHGGEGEAHIGCATMCARGGQTLMFLEKSSGRTYPLIAVTHGKDPDDEWIPFIGRPVQVQGVLYVHGADHALVVRKVTFKDADRRKS